MDEQQWAAAREVSRLQERRTLRIGLLCGLAVIALALTFGTPNPVFSGLLVILAILLGTLLYRRVLRHVPTYARLFKLMQAHYRGENEGNLVRPDDLGGGMSFSDQQKFTDIMKNFNSDTDLR